MYEKAKAGPKTFEMIKARERAQYEYQARLAYAERQGKAEGRAEGRAEGMRQGRAEGALKKAIESAKNFLKMGLSAEQVAQGTGLSIKDVRALI